MAQATLRQTVPPASIDNLEPLTSDQIRALSRHSPRELALAGGPIPGCWCRACRPGEPR